MVITKQHYYTDRSEWRETAKDSSPSKAFDVVLSQNEKKYREQPVSRQSHTSEYGFSNRFFCAAIIIIIAIIVFVRFGRRIIYGTFHTPSMLFTCWDGNYTQNTRFRVGVMCRQKQPFCPTDEQAPMFASE